MAGTPFIYQPGMQPGAWRMSNSETRNRIILAAGPIFARKGYRAATVREICDAANVNLASINYYFGDKQSLYRETVMRAREMRAQEFPEKPRQPGETPEQRLRHIVSTLLHRVVALQTEPWQVRLVMREILQPTEVSRTLMTEAFRPFFESLLEVIDELAGENLPDAKRHQIGFSIVGQCMQYRFSSELISIMIAEKDFQESFQIENLTDHITSFSLGAIDSLRHNPSLNHKNPIQTNPS